ncbi:MAG TPA: tyrosine--tRNA ligase [Ruminiclostridium sp.]|jgi:tyrosyl-tRNA synthetase|uniref:Tyrosine--tRNA ligase n=1 Tax=Acetivibrio saccincola TaxID=1677857 RepID=A0A2K9EEA4_9FIRM|nr:tyrosine--tRNA ligase [Acetivibrio saccincola]AUG57545.1 Tyrosine--tRNA ligase [Acetivibrio saccincola]NLW26042.1 tyrosine--tRNA ligase [Acetivibrio saccincola]PQQ67456.1 tyrosine--tRNA ligase [Acetivibrio saccincola]HAA43750.1 tyrosine--tRNA ligase [Ruminiclostridium sp.]
MSVFQTLKERGFIAQLTHEETIKKILENEKITFYIGFDPTADSLHVGHFLQMLVMSHMQKAGHRPIAIIGGGTTMVGDPTGKTDMRRMMTREEIQKNAENFKKQLSRFIDFSDGKALMLDNADWILELKYVDFLREIGVHFSVNRMLTAECFKTRLERGLSFIEFNYMLMQSYDFLKLFQEYNCVMQLGGDDQWSNILGGIDLIRRVEGKEAYGMTFTLLTNSEGVKMGKTEKGAVWLDPDKTPPYDFYQYWRNIDDKDVIKCMKLLTFLPMEEIEKYSKLEGQEINEAKKVLAYEVTKLIHGEEEALKAQNAAEALFGKGVSAADMPTTEITPDEIKNGINIIDLLVKTKLVPSKGEGRRLIQQGGIYVENERIKEFDFTVKADDFKDNELIIKKGKKVYHKVKLV